MEVHTRLLRTSRTYRKNRQRIERFTQDYVKNNARTGLRSGIVRIPVVVHVVHNTSVQNISDAQIQSQIPILNRDFRRLNADASSVPAAFQPVAADARIEFQLAVRDPNCTPTTGITRTSTKVTSFIKDDKVKSGATGGINPWPRDKYLNIWVCNLIDYLGYASFPGAPAAEDGLVIRYTCFGDMGTVAAPYDTGRTVTHEIGHWLNLLHIWGNEPAEEPDKCSFSDNVADTPNQADFHFGCPSFPQVSCMNGPDGDMFMNYMDYVDDRCMFMFTAGQSARMNATLYGPRSPIVGSDGLIPPLSTGADLWSQDKPEDIGDEPNTILANMWESDDIWVRKQNDGMINQEHQNPEYRASGFGSNFVYVRIRNRGCGGAGSGTVKLYWAKASTNLGWPAPFDGSVTSPALMGGLIGTQPTSSVPAGGFIILEFPWFPPNPADYSSFGADKSHFCLLSRIETSSTSPFGMTFPEGSNLYSNVQNNNNIVWKNITVVDEFPGGGRIGWVTVGASPSVRGPLTKLVFTSPKEGEQKSIFDWGAVTIVLGTELFKKWRESGSVGEGIKAVDATAGQYIIVLGTNAWIGGLKLRSEELYTVSVEVRPHNKEPEGNAVFFLDLTQYTYGATAGDSVIGGQRFVVKTIAGLQHGKGKEEKLVFDGATWVRRLTKTVARSSIPKGSGLGEGGKKLQTTRTRRRA